MSCNCHDKTALADATAIVKKKPCGPCAQAAAAIASTVPIAEGGTRVAGLAKRQVGAATYTVSSTNIALMVFGAAVAGGTVVYLATQPKRRRR